MMPDPPARLIQFEDYDVVIPFLCQRCGGCCRNYYPKIDLEMLPEIEQMIHLPIQAIQSQLQLDCEAYTAGKPTDCFFLDSISSTCRIHAVRPHSCRSFPTLAGVGASPVNCPGYREYWNVMAALSNTGESARVRNPTSARQGRPIPYDRWEMISHTLSQAKATAHYIRTFNAMNGRPGCHSQPALPTSV